MSTKPIKEINHRFNHETDFFPLDWNLEAVEDADGVVIKHDGTVTDSQVSTLLAEQMDPPHHDVIRRVETRNNTVTRLSGRLFRLIMLGDTAVGKTTLVSSLVGLSVGEVKATLAVDLKVVYHGGHQFHIWDTAGQERFQSVVSSYYRGLNCALLTFDLTNRESFEHVQNWLDQLERYADKKMSDIHLVLVGNKFDLAELSSGRKVTHTEAVKFAKKHSMQYIEITALAQKQVEPDTKIPKWENKQVEELFSKIFEWLIKHHFNARNAETHQNRIGVSMALSEDIPNTSYCCT